MISWFERYNKVSWGITIFGAILIFYLSSLPFESLYSHPGKSSIVYHVLAFFFLTFFLLISLIKGKSNYFKFILAILVVMLYSVSDELHQLFVPGRFCTVFDIICNFIGILFAGLIYLIRLNFKR